ncbi:10038_t:CDS:1, partial [Entrophospora sp. SA101]
KGELQFHTKYHFGIKDFKCEYPGCTKAYYQKNELKGHTRRHLRIKDQ